MPNILVRDLDAETIRHIKERAHRNSRSMQSELKNIIEMAARSESLDAALLSARMRRMLGEGDHSDSGEFEEGDI